MINASIVTYHTELSELGECLGSLNSPLVGTIYVVDNSRSPAIEAFCRGYSKVTYIPSDNRGYGAGHNQALRLSLARGVKYHLVVNSDVHFAPAILEKIVAYMDANADVGQLIPRTVYPDGRPQYVCRMLPTPANLIFRRFLPQSWVAKMNYRYLMQFANHEQPMNVPYHQGSFMFFRVESLNRVGLFDERFFMYPEDIDITRRMHRLYRTMYWPGVTIVHAHRASSYHNGRMLRIHIVNMIRYFNKWGWIHDPERRAWNRQLLDEYGNGR